MSASAVHIALKQYDILLYLFEIFEARSGGPGRRTLASCALVCQVWSGPACQVLWRTLGSFLPLWALLAAGRNFPPSARRLTEYWEYVEAEKFVKNVATTEPERWQQFLRRASHVREIVTASCGAGELALIRAVIKHNGGSTFLPSLRTLSWRHVYPSDVSLLFVASSSLRSLDLSTAAFEPDSGRSRPNDYTQSQSLFAGLPTAVPYLSRLVISGHHLPGSVVLPHLVGFTHMRQLLLFDRLCSLTPQDVNRILEAMPCLEHLSAHVVDFANPTRAAASMSLRGLRLKGEVADLAGLFDSGLDAPLLGSLMLTIDGSPFPANRKSCLSVLPRTSFAASLRTLEITLLTRLEGPLQTAIQPLAGLRNLEDVQLRIASGLSRFDDDDVLALALAWKHLRRLAVSYVPPDTVPSLAALHHFAEHCPELRELALTKMHIPAALDVPAGDAERRPSHGLRTLDLRMTAGRLTESDRAGVARFLDWLFPNLELSEAERPTKASDGLLMPWYKIIPEIASLRARRVRATDEER